MKLKIAAAEPTIPVHAFDDQRELQVAALLHCTEHHPPERVLMCIVGAIEPGPHGACENCGISDPVRFELAMTPEASEQLEAQLRACRSLAAGATPDGEDATTARARRMFNAYNEKGGWKTFDGRPVPKWEDLGDEVRSRWAAAAEAA